MEFPEFGCVGLSFRQEPLLGAFFTSFLGDLETIFTLKFDATSCIS